MKRQHNTLFAIGMSAALLLISCGESEQAITSTTPATETAGTYADVVPIITLRCAICHVGGGTQPELGGLANMKKHGWDAYDAMADGSMPPGGPRVSTEELSRVHAWLIMDSIQPSQRDH